MFSGVAVAEWLGRGASAMIAMSILQSVAAGVGTEAMNNRPELAGRKATEQIERQTQTLENMPATSHAYEGAGREYQAALLEFQRMSRGDSNWNTSYVRLYGPWGDRDRDWSGVPFFNRRSLILEKNSDCAVAHATRTPN
ncbi:hypothetical protein ACL6C3_12790 [Capilliphycus salinus ALCB114379]|uniref:hypothetical protein n=1 Tax=Capilliphycus salinus TaxID=2768948 RepID=UPI0039A6ADA0